MPQRNVAHPLVTRAAEVLPASINEAEHTAEVVFTTGAQVRRYDWMRGQEFLEELEVSESAVDLTRLNAGAAFLDSHNSWATVSIGGVTVRAWIDGKQGKALLRFDVEGETGKELWRKVKGGFLRFVSVGYTVERFVESMRDGIRVLTAVRWTPHEISAVAVPADAGASFRSATPIVSQCTITRSEDEMEETEDERKAREKREADAKAEAERAQADAVKRATDALQQRTQEIFDLCALSGRSLAEANELVRSNKPVADIRKELVDKRAAADEGMATSGALPGGAGAAATTGLAKARMQARFAPATTNKGA